MDHSRAPIPGEVSTHSLRDVLTNPLLEAHFDEAFENAAPAVAAKFVLRFAPTLELLGRMLAHPSFIPSGSLVNEAMNRDISEEGVMRIIERVGIPIMLDDALAHARYLGYDRVVRELSPKTSPPGGG